MKRFGDLCPLSCFNFLVPLQEVRNTVGNIPLDWYEDYPHLGYDIDGRPRPKPVSADEVGVALTKPSFIGCCRLSCDVA